MTDGRSSCRAERNADERIPNPRTEGDLTRLAADVQHVAEQQSALRKIQRFGFRDFPVAVQRHPATQNGPRMLKGFVHGNAIDPLQLQTSSAELIEAPDLPFQTVLFLAPERLAVFAKGAWNLRCVAIARAIGSVDRKVQSQRSTVS